jgi:N-acetylglucosamine kinase
MADKSSEAQLAIDIGATKTAFGIFSNEGELIHLQEEPTETSDWDAFATMLQANVAQIEEQFGAVDSIGISIAGTVDPRNGIAACANVPSISGRNLASDLEQLTGRKVRLGNDAECLGLAEAIHGAGQHYRHVFAIVLGSGIGGSIIIDGRLITGATGQIGEWGHGNHIDHLVARYALESRQCGCGRRNCLDLFGAGLGMANIHEDLSGTRTTAMEILSLWHAADAAATETVTTFVEIVSSQLVLAVNVIDPDIVPVAGGLSNDQALIEALDQATRARSLGRIERPLIVPAKNNVHGCLLGASLLREENTGPAQ